MWPTESVYRRDLRYDNEPESDVVEVRGEDGLFRQATIVDCTEDGLMIDWKCDKEPTAHFIRFEDAYLSKCQQFCPFPTQGWNAVDKDQEILVQVLFRQSPKEPSTWYPGTLLAGALGTSRSFSKFGLVNAACPGGTKVVVVPGNRIRRPPTADMLQMMRVHKGYFVKQNLLLPKTYSHEETFARQLIHVMNQRDHLEIARTRTFIRAVGIDGERLQYIRIGYDIVPENQQDLAPIRLEQLVDLAAAECDRMQTQQNNPPETRLASLSHEQHECGTTSVSSHGIYLLPRHILACIFEQLDSVEQCRIRRVSAYWNSIVAMSCVVRVRYCQNKQDFMSVASLHHGWTSHTEIIINAGVETISEPLFWGGQLFSFLVEKELHAPVKTIILANVSRNLKFLRGDPLTTVLQSFVGVLNNVAAVCQNLVLQNILVTSVKMEDVFNTVVLKRGVHILNGRIASVMTVEELWSRMDDSLPSFEHAQLQQISDWIAAGCMLLPGHDKQWSPWISRDQQYSRHGRREVVDVLNDLQSHDPRDGAHYRGREWTMTDLVSLELQQLSKITLHSFIALKNSTSITFTVSW